MAMRSAAASALPSARMIFDSRLLSLTSGRGQDRCSRRVTAGGSRSALLSLLVFSLRPVHLGGGASLMERGLLLAERLGAVGTGDGGAVPERGALLVVPRAGGMRHGRGDLRVVDRRKEGHGVGQSRSRCLWWGRRRRGWG